MDPLVLLSLSAVFLSCANAALYEISIDAFEPHSNSDPNFMDYGTLRVSKKSRNTFMITGEFEYLVNVGDGVKVVYEITKGDASMPMIAGETGFCESLNSDSKVMDKLREVSNLPEAGTCPFPKGKYYINKYVLDESQLPLMVPPGKYALHVMMVDGDDIKAGYKLYITIK